MDQPERLAGYEQFFGLKEPPFSLTPDPHFLFASASHSAALAQVAYAIDRREPIVVVTGEIGTGKTLLCRTVLQRLPRKTFLSVVNDPLLGPDDLLKQLLQDFGVISHDRAQATAVSRHELVDALQAFLRSLASIQAHAVVIIDEAQHLHPEVLEQIRLLSNIDDERGTLLQIILVGQTDVEPLLSRPELRQIQQRVSRRFRLERLTRPEVQQYIEHRLACAREGTRGAQSPGASDLARALAEWEGDNPSVEFAPAAIEAISQISGGLPRLINLICDRALERAFAAHVRVIDVPLVHAAARAVGVDDPFWTAARPEIARVSPASIPEAVTPAAESGAEDAVPAPFQPEAATAPSTRPRKVVFAAAALVVAAVAILIAFRAAGPRATAVRPAPPSTPSPSSANRAVPSNSRTSAAPTPQVPSPTRQAVGPAVVAPSQPRAAGTAAAGVPDTRAPVATEPPTPASPRPAAPPAGGFEILVAAFRTEPRAASVQAEVSKLGLPARRRMLGTWAQVICGPFPSRTSAEEAQQRLNRAGFAGTQIVLAP